MIARHFCFILLSLFTKNADICADDADIFLICSETKFAAAMYDTETINSLAYYVDMIRLWLILTYFIIIL